MTKVSICCSVKNQSKWLREMIASVVAQTFTDWEMVLVDDGSAEDIKAVVQEFNDSRIRFGKRYRRVREADGGGRNALATGARGAG
jgi:glycosyltransferase involved in cell wall biosynthesis